MQIGLPHGTIRDYAAWETAGEPEAFVWGVQWSMAYPGLTYDEESADAATWAQRLGRDKHTVTVETEAYQLTLIFHDFRVEKLNDDSGLLDRVFIPIDNK
jgi:hypothetical protein